MKLSTKILIGLFLGIFTGVFLGEYAEPLHYIGDAFIGLMQMTVMPYILVSLLSNIGKVKLSEQRALIKSAAVVLVILLICGLGAVFLLPMFFPTWESSSFFSSNLVTLSEPLDYIRIYIPHNIFGSLAENVVPAVVLFAIIVGVALNSIPNNTKFIQALDVFGDALNIANKHIVKLTPFGIFGIAAHTAGMMSLDELGLIQVYVVIYTVAVVILGLIFIPLVVSAVTPFRFKDFLNIPRSTLLTIFATGKIVILLPQLIENVKELFKKYNYEDDQIDSSAELMLPLAYPFPNLGTLVIMVFVPFAAWFAGKPFTVGDQFGFLGSALLSSFVAPITGIPFLMDTLKLPQDIFQLFIVSTAYTDRIRVVLGSIHLFGLTVIAIAYARGLVKIHALKLTRAFAITIGLSLILLLPFKFLIGESFQESFDKYESFMQMDITTPRVVQVIPDSTEYYIPSSIQAIQEKGYVRVGYMSDALPYVFFNEHNRKVGLDVELINLFAYEMGIKLQWIQIDRSEITQAINEGRIDIFASGVPVLVDIMDKAEFSEPYSEMNLSLLIKDHKRDKYKDINHIIQNEEAYFATNQSDYLKTRITEELPGTRFEQVESVRTFVEGDSKADAMFFSAEAGSAWTLVYPEYCIIHPEGLHIKMPVSWMMAKDNLELVRFINKWIELKQYDGTIDQLYSYWILGEGTKKKEPKWSIIRNVLHWVE
ncbi:hypothetical protein BFP72_14850 [Reichenbachiella sp. 5M10]|uniref:cation:dicarboxylate symporter family transporter n=1 Tax=Reichenbachiella sp. 5M10 TaxID=1889772 RepID=UPI000C147D90|nr:cation:dicarboxylase symporter family transporter [Reichenbachiella sp. 5M10]PIB36588.1 hypothetical protein BFP72_14850 [Reichenbachiella sp. 5M10]